VPKAQERGDEPGHQQQGDANAPDDHKGQRLVQQPLAALEAGNIVPQPPPFRVVVGDLIESTARIRWVTADIRIVRTETSEATAVRRNAGAAACAIIAES
jgi:hypothetical protein